MTKKKRREEQGEENKKVGLIAQKEFDAWCTPARLTANRSSEDDEGWDFFIQAKSSNEPVPFLDRKPPAFSALVQVKGTTDASGSFRLTLSNALKLVINHTGPAFIFVAHVEHDVVRQAWLMHCGQEFITKTLETAVKHKTKKHLNETWLTFRPSHGDVVTRSTLREGLERHIGDVRKYFDWKRDVIENAGYEHERFEVRVRHAARTDEEAYDALADLVIGVRELPAESVDIFDVRFGEARWKKTITKPTLSRPIVPSDPDTVLVVESGDGERIQVSCNGYLASAYVPFLPAASNRLRLVAPFLEFLVMRAPAQPDTMMLRWSTPGIDSPVSSTNLEDKARAASLFRLIRQPGAKVGVRFKSGKEIAIPLTGDWAFDNEKAAGYLKALEDYRVVTKTYGIPLEGGEVRPEQLVRVAHQLDVLARIATQREIDAEVRFPKNEPPPGVGLGDHVSFVVGSMFGFPTKKLLVVTSVSGKVEEHDGFYQVRATRLPQLGYRVFTHVTNEAVEAQLQAGGEVLRSLGAAKVFLRPLDSVPESWLPPSTSRSKSKEKRRRRRRPSRSS